MEKMKSLLLQTLEQLANDWKEAKLPQEILLNDRNVNIILTTRALVSEADSGLTLRVLKSEAPTFVEQVQLATMREFEELTPDGATD